MRFGLARTVDATVEPISVADAKAQRRIGHAREDTLLTALIGAVRQGAEVEVGRAFLRQTWVLTLPAFPAGAILLPRPPLIEVVSLEYRGADGSWTTWSSANYQVAASYEPARVSPIPSTPWPTTGNYDESVRVTFRAGYGTEPTAVPRDFWAAMMLQLGDAFELREETVVGVSIEPTGRAKELLARHRFIYLGPER